MSRGTGGVQVLQLTKKQAQRLQRNLARTEQPLQQGAVALGFEGLHISDSTILAATSAGTMAHLFPRWLGRRAPQPARH